MISSTSATNATTAKIATIVLNGQICGVHVAKNRGRGRGRGHDHGRDHGDGDGRGHDPGPNDHACVENFRCVHRLCRDVFASSTFLSETEEDSRLSCRRLRAQFGQCH